MTNRRIVSLVLLLCLRPAAVAGLYYSGENHAELPAQWRGFLVDQRSLRMLAAPPIAGQPPSPLKAEYRDALARLEKKANPSADDLADLGALYLRLGQPAKAVELLRGALRQHPEHFRVAANLGTAWHLHGDLQQASESLRLAVKLAPPKLRAAEELHLKLVRVRQKKPQDVQSLDNLFGIKFVGNKGEWAPGTIAADQWEKLPANALENMQRLALWLPADGRLLWQLAEIANAAGDVRTASAVFDGLVTEFGLNAPDVRQRRQALREVVATLAPVSRTDDSMHSVHQKLTFRSPRALARRFDASTLPIPAADRANPLPWGLLAETTIDSKFRPAFPDYLKKVDGKIVALTGFLQPLGEAHEASAFLLIEYPIGCWFCETPPPTGIVLVELPRGKSMTLKRGLIKVEGTLKLNATDPEDFLFSLKDAKIGEVD
jgi:hypothetical protein